MIKYKMTTRADEDFGAEDKSYGSSPISKDGKCDHMLQIPNAEKTRCIIPQRIDVGKHYLLTGGFYARKEKYADLVSRVKMFQHFFPEFLRDPSSHPEIRRVLENKEYR